MAAMTMVDHGEVNHGRPWSTETMVNHDLNKYLDHGQPWSQTWSTMVHFRLGLVMPPASGQWYVTLTGLSRQGTFSTVHDDDDDG